MGTQGRWDKLLFVGASFPHASVGEHSLDWKDIYMRQMSHAVCSSWKIIANDFKKPQNHHCWSYLHSIFSRNLEVVRTPSSLKPLLHYRQWQQEMCLQTLSQTQPGSVSPQSCSTLPLLGGWSRASVLTGFVFDSIACSSMKNDQQNFAGPSQVLSCLRLTLLICPQPCVLWVCSPDKPKGSL